MWHKYSNTDEKSHQHHSIHYMPWRSSPVLGLYVEETHVPLSSHNNTSVLVVQTTHASKWALLPIKKILPSEYQLIWRQQKHFQNRKQLLALHDGLLQMILHQHECSTNYEDDRLTARVALPEHIQKTNYNKVNSTLNFLFF